METITKSYSLLTSHACALYGPGQKLCWDVLKFYFGVNKVSGLLSKDLFVLFSSPSFKEKTIVYLDLTLGRVHDCCCSFSELSGKSKNINPTWLKVFEVSQKGLSGWIRLSSTPASERILLRQFTRPTVDFFRHDRAMKSDVNNKKCRVETKSKFYRIRIQPKSFRRIRTNLNPSNSETVQGALSCNCSPLTWTGKEGTSLNSSMICTIWKTSGKKRLDIKEVRHSVFTYL